MEEDDDVGGSSSSWSGGGDGGGGLTDELVRPVLTSLLPMLFVVCLGVVVTRRGSLNVQHEQSLNYFNLWLAAPALFFRIIAKSNFFELPWAIAGLVVVHRIFMICIAAFISFVGTIISRNLHLPQATAPRVPTTDATQSLDEEFSMGSFMSSSTFSAPSTPLTQSASGSTHPRRHPRLVRSASRVRRKRGVGKRGGGVGGGLDRLTEQEKAALGFTGSGSDWMDHWSSSSSSSSSSESDMFSFSDSMYPGFPPITIDAEPEARLFYQPSTAVVSSHLSSPPATSSSPAPSSLPRLESIDAEDEDAVEVEMEQRHSTPRSSCSSPTLSDSRSSEPHLGRRQSSSPTVVSDEEGGGGAMIMGDRTWVPPRIVHAPPHQPVEFTEDMPLGYHPSPQYSSASIGMTSLRSSKGLPSSREQRAQVSFAPSATQTTLPVAPAPTEAASSSSSESEPMPQDTLSVFIIMTMVLCMSNTGVFGLPLVREMYGEEYEIIPVVITSVDFLIVVPLLFALLELRRQLLSGAFDEISSSTVALGSSTGALKFGSGVTHLVILRTLSNPIMGAIVLGALYSISGLSYFTVLDNTMAILGDCLFGVALLALGIFIGSRSLLVLFQRSKGEMLGLFLLRFLVAPLVMLALELSFLSLNPSAPLRIGKLEAQITALVTALPSALFNFSIAREYDLAAEAVSSNVVLTTLASLPVLILYALFLQVL